MGKLKGKITQAASHLYSEETIRDKAVNGTHRGESMQDIAANIFSNPNIVHEAGENGVTNMKVGDKVIGWYDRSRGIGNIDQKAYDEIKKQSEELRANEERELPDFSDYGDDDDDMDYDPYDE